MVNARMGWQGSLWQGRFFSNPMDEIHTAHAVRYIEQNPVRAGIVRSIADYEWSSARAHLRGCDDELVRVEPMLLQFPDWDNFAGQEVHAADASRIACHARTGRPLVAAPPERGHACVSRGTPWH
jgi:putative transposase